MFGIGETELVLIVLFAFMVFGPDKLPGMGRTIGRALRQFRNAQEGFTQVVQAEIVDPAAEAMGADGKKPNRKRAEEFEEDADLEGADDAPRPKRTETFAERKKRLAEEHAAAQKAAKEAEAATAATAGDADSDADADAPVATPAAAPAAEAKPAVAAKPTAADLYSMKRPSNRVSAAEGVTGGDVSAASRAASEPSGERRASGGVSSVSGAPAGQTPDDEKEA